MGWATWQSSGQRHLAARCAPRALAPASCPSRLPACACSAGGVQHLKDATSRTPWHCRQCLCSPACQDPTNPVAHPLYSSARPPARPPAPAACPHPPTRPCRSFVPAGHRHLHQPRQEGRGAGEPGGPQVCCQQERGGDGGSCGHPAWHHRHGRRWGGRVRVWVVCQAQRCTMHRAPCLCSLQAALLGGLCRVSAATVRSEVAPVQWVGG